MKSTILIELSEGCNLDCSYCLQDKHSKNSLDLETFKVAFENVLSKIDIAKCTGIEFNFYGGEPLLYFDRIKEIMLFLLYRRSNVFFKKIPFTYTMPSNLLPLTKEKENFIIEHNINISFSYDGLNQSNRPLLSGSSSIPIYDEKTERIKSFISRLKRNKIGFKIHSMIFPSFKILDNYNFIFEKFGVEPEFNIVKDHGVWDEESLTNIIKELEILKIDSLQHNIVHPFLVTGIHKIMQYDVDKYTSNCGAGVNNFSILDNGNVRACERMKNEVDDPNILRELDHPKCRVCPIRNYCDKGCPFETRNGGLVPLCVYYKSYFKLCFEMIEFSKQNPDTLKCLKQELKRIVKC